MSESDILAIARAVIEADREVCSVAVRRLTQPEVQSIWRSEHGHDATAADFRIVNDVQEKFCEVNALAREATAAVPVQPTLTRWTPRIVGSGIVMDRDMDSGAWVEYQAVVQALAAAPVQAAPQAQHPKSGDAHVTGAVQSDGTKTALPKDRAKIYSLIVCLFKQPDELLRSMIAQDLTRLLKLGTWATTAEERELHLASARAAIERDQRNGFLPASDSASGATPSNNLNPVSQAAPAEPTTAEILLQDAQEYHLACVKDLYSILGIDGSDGEYRYKWAALELRKRLAPPAQAGEPTDAKLDAMWRECMGEPVPYRTFARAILGEARKPTAVSVDVPQGWQLVPIEPTMEMIKAGASHAIRLDEDEDKYRARGQAIAIYKDMLGAAIKPDTQQADLTRAVRDR